MRKLIEYFYQSAKKYPKKTAVWCDGKTATYEELEELVNQCAHFLAGHGVGYQDHIGIPMTNCIESVALIFAAAGLGAGLVPINPTLPAPAIKAAFQSGQVRHLIARKAFYREWTKDQKLPFQGLCVCLDGEFDGTVPFAKVREASQEHLDSTRITGEETLILTMTSGSTGEPKPIDLSQNNKLERALAHIRLYELTPGDRVLAATPLYHSLAERLVILPLILGATSILLPRFTPNLWLNCVAQQRVTFTIAVSAQLSQVMELLSSPLAPQVDSLRCVVSSSALLESHVKSALIEKLHCEFHEMYGTSETSTVTDISLKESLEKQKSVGTCLKEAKVRILKEDGACAAPLEVGEIAVKSSLQCKGYYGMPKKLEEAMCDGYFRTGDLGYLDEDNYLYFSGRKKELIITGGINVYPRDVEECVRGIEQVESCAAFSYPDERLGEVVALAVVPKKGSVVTVREIRTRCARRLADYQQPHKIFLVERLPENAMGKLIKNKLLEYVRLHCEE